jgi:hypothetical protein
MSWQPTGHRENVIQAFQIIQSLNDFVLLRGIKGDAPLKKVTHLRSGNTNQRSQVAATQTEFQAAMFEILMLHNNFLFLHSIVPVMILPGEKGERSGAG